jgi:hypothetical protein
LSKEDHYFQFPLTLLTYDRDWPDNLREIADWCAFEQAAGSGCDLDDRGCCDFVNSRLGFRPDNWALVKQRHEWVASHLKNVPFYGANETRVRIRADIFWETANGGGLNEIQFKTLCAIYSSIGQSEYRRITIDQIIQRAAGCAAKFSFEDEHDHWDGAGIYRTIYTAAQIRRAVQMLFLRGFFAMITRANRETYYSNRLSQDQLIAEVERRSLAKAVRAAQRSALQSAMNVRIAVAKAHLIAGEQPALNPRSTGE